MGAFEQKSEEEISTKNTKGGHGKHISEAHLECDKYPHTITITQWLQCSIIRNTGIGEDYLSPNV